ncbi:hypothetical protein JMJ35_003971 [Cladonia borealis]|uniref:Short chain dehydrogenase n=1 Tax=Cladonia borealis TaxID=184061 RepID=A0AA39R2A5_9LECA|nr:hypothetical protein JMJ35_003971 [Cladonia borealis]
MARILITGSSDGLGQISARALISQGHKVTLHARNTERAKQASEGAPGAEDVLIADLSSIAQTKALAAEADKRGPFDAVMHNAGLGYQEGYRGDANLKEATFTLEGRSWNSLQAYSDSKLHDVMLAFAVARHWPDVESNACSPGWVKTKMGGAGAPGNAEKGARTQIHLAGTKEATGSGKYWIDLRPSKAHPAAGDVAKQEEFLRICEGLTGVAFPKG